MKAHSGREREREEERETEEKDTDILTPSHCAEIVSIVQNP